MIPLSSRQVAGSVLFCLIFCTTPEVSSDRDGEVSGDWVVVTQFKHNLRSEEGDWLPLLSAPSRNSKQRQGSAGPDTKSRV